jgi:hypothetical protein
MPVREFHDDAGNVWTAWTTFPKADANVRPQYRRGWLSFQCHDRRRRLVPIPESWQDAGEEQLRAYLLQAHDAQKAEGLDTPPQAIPHTEQRSEAEGEEGRGGVARIRRILRGIRIRGGEE